ncbi:hypothetical protein [Pendulispora albinea]|uniref:Uncharacterized protein n=1 Tax=Pendulispora albinea TaxID=2741071 RepID=A0ABZ2M8F7_9BACT
MTRRNALVPLLLAVAAAAVASFPAMPAYADPASEADAGAPAGAQKDPQTPPSLIVRATPVFGNESAIGNGWTEIAVNLENMGTTASKGSIELTSRQLAWSSHEDFITRAPFHVAGGRSVVVKLPTHGLRAEAPSISVRVSDPSGKTIASTSLGSIPYAAPLLVDVHQPSRLAPVLRNWPVTVKWSHGRVAYRIAPAGLSVGVPSFDRTTGDPILPDRAAGYSSAVVVLMPTDLLARLETQSADALVSWVIAGGTLALVPTRVDDLRSPVVTKLLGGAATSAPPPPTLMSLPGRVRPTEGGLFPPEPLDTEPDDPPTPLRFDPGAPAPGSSPWTSANPSNPFLPLRTTDPPAGKKAPSGPSPTVRGKLQGYAGGNLVPSAFGASAAYGSGEVHLLPFDPSEPPMLDDPWVQGRMVDLMEHAWDRRAINVIAHGGGEQTDMNFDGVRRALDPNENFRPALGVAAILLVLYSIVAGPLTFLRASRKGKPLAPLLWAPVFSLATFLIIVLVGFAVKGWSGRARHLSLVEAGAGVPRGAIRRYRGFFTSESRALSIASTEASSLLSVASADSMSSQDKSALSVDRNGVSLEDINALPWQTIVVLEDGLYDFKGGLSIVNAGDGSLDVANHTGRDLKNVLISVPGDGIHHLEDLADGGKVHAADLPLLVAAHALPGGGSGGSSSMLPVHELSIDTVLATLTRGAGRKQADAIRSAWGPLDGALGSSVDWWPDSVPVVMAEVAGGEGTKRDGHLPVESDRLLLRVIGRGGAL